MSAECTLDMRSACRAGRLAIPTPDLSPQYLLIGLCP